MVATECFWAAAKKQMKVRAPRRQIRTVEPSDGTGAIVAA